MTIKHTEENHIVKNPQLFLKYLKEIIPDIEDKCKITDTIRCKQEVHPEYSSLVTHVYDTDSENIYWVQNKELKVWIETFKRYDIRKISSRTFTFNYISGLYGPYGSNESIRHYYELHIQYTVE